MIPTFSKRLLIALLAFSLIAINSVQVAFAESPVFSETVHFTVIAQQSTPSLGGSRPNGYIGMYVVTPKDDGTYSGKLVSIKKQSNGKSPKFKITAGRIVDFVAFSNKQYASNAKNWTFTTPPFKNFGDTGYSTLCRINKSNIYSMLTVNGVYSCMNDATIIPFSDKYVSADAYNSNSPKNSLAVAEAWPMETSDVSTLVKDANVQLYDEYGNRVANIVNTGERGLATIIVRRGQRYYLEAEKNGRKYGGKVTASFTGTKNGSKVRLYPQGSNYTPSPTPAAVTLNQPTITYPPNNSTLNGRSSPTALVVWQSISMATGYEIKVETLCPGCTGGWGYFQNITTQNSNSVSTNQLVDNASYRVSMRARRDVAGMTTTFSNWSSYVYFNYNAINPAQVGIATPVITYPNNNEQITNNGIPKSVEVTWNPVSGARNYMVSLNYICSNCDYWTELQQSSVTGSTRFVTPTLSANTQYYVKIRAYDYEGQASSWSAFRFFTFGAYSAPAITLTAPVIYSPAANLAVANDGTPKQLSIQWNAVNGAIEYEINVDALCANCASWADVQTERRVSTNMTTDVLSYSQYRYQVRALGANGAVGPWSAFEYFTYGSYTPVPVAPAVPVITSPVDNLFIVNTGVSRTITITWNAVANATMYDVDIDSKCSICASWSDFQYGTANGNTSMTTASLNGDTQYRVRVRSVKTGGLASSYSGYTYFTYGPAIPAALGTPTITKPSPDSILNYNAAAVNINFTAVDGATSYQYEITCWNCEANPKSYGIVGAVSTTVNVSPAGLARNGNLSVHVRALRNGEVGAWSPYTYFTFSQPAN